MSRKKYQTRLSDDTAERVEQYIEDRDISEAEAMRRFIGTGLEVEEYSDDKPRSVRWELLPIYVGMAGLAAWAGALSMIVLAEAGAPTATVDSIGVLSGLLALLFLASPFVAPAYNRVRKLWP